MELRILLTIMFCLSFTLFMASVTGDGLDIQSPIVYTKAQLFALLASAVPPSTGSHLTPQSEEKETWYETQYSGQNQVSLQG